MLSSRSLLVYASCCLDFRDLYLFNHELKINAFHCYIWILHWQPNRVGPPWLSSKFYSDLIRSKTCVTPNSPCSITSQFWLNLDFTPFGLFFIRGMNRLTLATRPVLARSFGTTTARAGGLPQKEQWILDWKDPVPVSQISGYKFY